MNRTPLLLAVVLLIAMESCGVAQLPHPYSSAKPGDIAHYSTTLVALRPEPHTSTYPESYKIVSNDGKQVVIEHENETLNLTSFHSMTLAHEFDLTEFITIKPELTARSTLLRTKEPPATLIVDGIPLVCDVHIVQLINVHTREPELIEKCWTHSQSPYCGIVQLDSFVPGKFGGRTRVTKILHEPTAYDHAKVERQTGLVAIWDTPYEITFPKGQVEYTQEVADDGSLIQQYELQANGVQYTVNTQDNLYAASRQLEILELLELGLQARMEIAHVKSCFEHMALTSFGAQLPVSTIHALPMGLVIKNAHTNESGEHARFATMVAGEQLLNIRVQGIDPATVDSKFDSFIESLNISAHPRISVRAAEKKLKDGMALLREISGVYERIKTLNSLDREFSIFTDADGKTKAVINVTSAAEQQQLGVNKAILAGRLCRVVKQAFPDDKLAREQLFDEIDRFDNSTLTRTARE
jgi:hypothetical protein